jgi:hypothetical protein
VSITRYEPDPGSEPFVGEFDTTVGIEAGSMLVWFDTTPRGGGVPSGVDQLRALGEPVGVGAGLDDGAAEGESVDDGGASLGSVKVLVQPEKDSLHAIATDAFSSRSVRT